MASFHPERSDELRDRLARHRESLENQRRRVRRDVDALLALPPAERQRWVLASPCLLNRPAVEALLDRALEAGFEDAREAERICRLTWDLCVRLGQKSAGHPAVEVRDLKALTSAAWGNAARILCDWDEAAIHFEAAYGYLDDASGDPLVLARILFHHASLLRDRQELEAALARVEGARRLYEDLGEARQGVQARLKAATILRTMGRYHEALVAHLEACTRLDEKAEPITAIAAWTNLAQMLCDQRRFDEAWGVLEASPQLAARFGPTSRITLTRAWVRGKALHGLGRFGAAQEQLLRARGGFLEQRAGYDAGLVGLDLALLYAEQGRLEQMRLSAEVACAAIRREDLHPDPRTALGIFLEAVRQQQTFDALRLALQKFWRAAERHP